MVILGRLTCSSPGSAMTIDWTPLADLIETHDRFLVTTHVRPDGDALGSEVGMAGLLRQKGKDVRVVNASPTPPRYDFLDPRRDAVRALRDDGPAAGPGRPRGRGDPRPLGLEPARRHGRVHPRFPGPRVVIDHHVSQDDLGAIFLKDTAAEATGILVMSAVTALGGTLTPEVATGLLTAIAMDTGWFRHPNTRPGTLRAVAELIESGAEIDAIYRHLFERNTLGRLRLMGETLAGLQDRARTAGSPMPRSRAHDLERTGAIPPGFRGPGRFHGQPARRRGGHAVHRAGARRVKVSFRSRNGLDCARLAATFGRRRPPRRGRRHACPSRWPRASTGCSPRSARPLIRRRFPRKDKKTSRSS